ncbi:MerR family transcriptional regulator [Streptosporangium lutulentum]|uniref:DNA-binding transcriptional MerR regulator n=1 Tax=Streptosporangium lutulentum TaxID=1461250 RepID=A0ABT9Q5C5_9ACTN|nr:MerR family transcriptional regulator [Streptosporangium lutulentum]MDP9841596.1 DNA-binding transcriptional MerR regulator [Streptosporangium lutulentum]
MSDKRLRTGEVAEAAGVNAQTLRYYHRRGLLQEPQRSNGGHRLYPPETVTVLRVIKVAQRLGFTLVEVADLVEAVAHRHGTSDSGLQARATAKLAEVEQKIADLRTIRDTLVQAVDAGCDEPRSALVSARLPQANGLRSWHPGDRES